MRVISVKPDIGDTVYYPVGPVPPITGLADPDKPPGWILEFKIEKEGEGGTKEIVTEKYDMRMFPGQGINAPPFEAETSLDLTWPPLGGSAVTTALLFQFGKWGYEKFKTNYGVEVSPVFTEYYAKTIDERRKVEAQLKNAFASLTQAVQDFELIDHDRRKYEEFLGYFDRAAKTKRKLDEFRKKNEKFVEQAEEFERSDPIKFEELKKTKAKEFGEWEKLRDEMKKANHVIRAMFVDEVDAHTGEGISMRSIAPRWPVIITDFMNLFDEEEDFNKIADRLKIPKAECVILATKNQLYREWKKFFIDSIKVRYESLLKIAIARKASITEYKDQVKPILSRFKALTELRESPGWRSQFQQKLSWFRPDTQAVSLDYSTIWAWRPFITEEMFKPEREAYVSISLEEAGFNEEEIKEIKAAGKSDTILGMPAVPIMDDVVRVILRQINYVYKTDFTAAHVYDVVEEINARFTQPERPYALKGAGPKWPFTPYYIFAKVGIIRVIMKFQDAMIEDIIYEPIITRNETQNIIIGRYLELKAMEKKLENDIATLVGEIDPSTFKKVEEIVKEKFPDVFKKAEELKEMRGEEKKEMGKQLKKDILRMRQSFNKFREKTGRIFRDLGLDMRFVYPGPYEKLMYERMTKHMQRAPGIAYGAIVNFLKRGVNIPPEA